MNQRIRSIVGPLLLIVLLALACSCASGPVNPSLSLSAEQGRQALDEMKQSPKPLKRPVLVIGGFMDPGVGAPQIARSLRKATGDDRIISVSVGDCGSFDECRERAIKAVDEAFPNAGPGWTTEVDVVGYSMGGIVARYAESPNLRDLTASPRRLRIARLFTISTPHRGAKMAAEWPVVNGLQRDLRPDSEFLAFLNARPIPFPLYPYVRLEDRQVGQANAAPPGMTPWWVSNGPLESAHGEARHDPRIIADIARRLRGEPAYATTPAATLPAKEH